MTQNEFLNAFGGVKAAYKPDILTCLANLSNDEVFTPPNLTNEVLDLLPQELFESPNTKFLDPVCKSGVFLREIARRLMKGLENIIPNEQERRNHIFTNQIFGIAITSLTAQMARRSVYCSKTANGDYSVCTAFKSESGNIKFEPRKHTFKHGSCTFCGASEREYGEKVRDKLESHAYEFIHLTDKEIKEMTEMKFDVIIGNPPYQMSDGGNSARAKPIYHLFVQQAKKLNPRYLTMIIPSRWFAGGKGLDDFRDEMLKDKSIRKLVDYAVAKDVFPGVSIAGGICYFLWDKDNKGLCEFKSIHNNQENTLIRDLAEYNIFVRYNQALSILHKVQVFGEKSISHLMSSRNPFGYSSSERGNASKYATNLTLHSSGGVGYVPEDTLMCGTEYVDKYKLIISKATSEHAGEADKDGKFRVVSTNKILAPKEICTDSYIIVGAFEQKEYAENLHGYIKTNFARFLLLQAVSSINLSKEKFQFVPMQDFSEVWTDEKLYKKYKLSQEEIDFIESMIRPMGGENE